MTETFASTSSEVRSRQITAALIVAMGSIGALAGAWYFQLVVGLAPCPLCLEQRVPYYLGVPVALAAAIFAALGHEGKARMALGLAGMLMGLSAFLGIYHAGIEWGFWAGPVACSGAGPATGSGNLLEQLGAARVVRCDEAAWRLFGFSLAGYNAVIATILTFVAMRGAMAKS